MLATIHALVWLLQPDSPAGGGGGRASGGGGGGGAGGAGGCMQSSGSLLMLAVMFAIFYFLLIRPQQKQARQREEMLKTLREGERVVTSGGLVGKITGVTDRYVTMEVAEKVRVKILRANVAGKDVPEPEKTK